MTSTALPPALLERLIADLGPENVVAESDKVEAVSRTCIPYRQIPSVMAYPPSSDQVQKVVLAAREYNVPVWPVSTGKNFGYGEKTACYPGGITMVMDRMTRIWQVDEELGYAVIEPGVTYKQLNDHLKATKSSLWADAAGTTEYASVLGNALDKGRGLTPYADHFGCLCGMDVVLADGRIMETGGGPEGNNAVRHAYKWGVGPYLDGLFGQSNLGIVVKAGIWLMPEPECFDFCTFEYTASDDRFGDFIDDMRRLTFQGAVRSRPHLANDFAMMCILDQYPHDLLKGGRCLTEEATTAWRKQHGVARWTFGCGLYGSRAEVRFQKRMIKRVLGRYGRPQFIGVAIQDNWKGRFVRWVAPFANRLMGKSDAFVQILIPAINLFRGIATDHFVRQVYFKSHREKPLTDIDPARDQCGFLWIGPVVPFTSKRVNEGLAMAKEVFARHEFDFFMEVIIESPRSVLLLTGIFYERNDPQEIERALAWYKEIRELFLDHGYPPYRVTTMSMPGSLERNPVSRDFLASLKQAVDPQNLIAPGRYGTPTRPPDDK